MKRIILTIALIIMAVCIFSLWETNRELKSQVKVLSEPKPVKVDTVYKPFIPIKPYKNLSPPKLITIYKYSDPVRVDSVIYHTDTVTMYVRDSIKPSKIDFNKDFLLNYPDSPKLLQMLLNGNDLSFNLLFPNGESTQYDYYIKPDRYKYHFNGRELTHERKSFFKNISPFVSYQIRPIKNLHDLDFGIKYNTNKFNYVMGINGYYYPNIKDNPDWDLFFKVEYKF